MSGEERRLRSSSSEVRINPIDQGLETEKSGGGRYHIELDIGESLELTEAQKDAILKVLVSASTQNSSQETVGEVKNSQEAQHNGYSEQSLLEDREEDFLIKQELSENLRTAVVLLPGVILGVLLVLLGTNI